MELVSVIVFLIFCLGLGFTVTRLFRIEFTDFYESAAISSGIGLSVLILLTAILPVLRIPLDFRVIFFLSILYPVFHILKEKNRLFKKKDIKRFVPSIYIGFLAVLFLFNFFMYHKGAFSYPYLENDDPWHHANVAKYISVEKTVFEPIPGVDLFPYIDARPPGYDGIMGIMLQAHEGVIWTLKFYNILFICMGIVFFFYFAKGVLASEQKAIIATAMLSMFPTYLTHFIWSHSLAMTMIIFGLFCILRFVEGWKTGLMAVIPLASIMLISETQAIKFGFLAVILLIVKSAMQKKIDRRFIAVGALAFIIGASIWWFPMITKYGISDILSEGVRGGGVGSFDQSSHPSLEGIRFWGIRGSATEQHGVYNLRDVFFARGQNMINVPIGVGYVMMILIITGFVYSLLTLHKKKRYPEVAAFFMFIFAFFGSFGGTTWWSPFALFTFRFWLLFAIFGSILATIGIFVIFALVKPLKVPKILVLSVLIAAVWMTSGAQKWELNTAQWPPGGFWTSEEEVQLYLFLDTLPKGTKIMPFSDIQRNHAVSFGVMNCVWCPDVREFKRDIINRTPEETYSFMKANGIEYLVLDLMSHHNYREVYGDDVFNVLFEKWQGYANSTSLYRPVYQNRGGVILKVL